MSTFLKLDKKKLVIAIGVVVFLLFGAGVYASGGITPASANGNVPDQIIASLPGGSTDNSRVISWRTPDTETTSYIQYKEGSNVDFDTDADIKTASTAAITYLENSNKTSGYSRFSIQLDNLVTGTYSYRIGNDNVWSDTNTIKIENQSTTVSGIFFADFQYGDNTVNKKNEIASDLMAEAFSKHPSASMAILGGDMVDSNRDDEYWNGFLDAASSTFSKRPLMTAVGNHEIGDYASSSTRKPLYYRDVMSMPTNSNSPDNCPEGYDEEFYSFDYGEAHFIVLSSNYMNPAETFISDEEELKIKNWITDDLSASLKQWNIVVMHQPAYPAADDKTTDWIQEKWLPIFEKSGVDLILCGHQHDFLRTKSMKNLKETSVENGIVQIMGNASEKKYEKLSGYSYIDKEFIDKTGYHLMDISETTLKVTAYEYGGNEFDSWSKTKSTANEFKVGDIDIQEYNYSTGTAITLDNVKFPKGKKSINISVDGVEYDFYRTISPDDGRTVLKTIIPVTFDDFKTDKNEFFNNDGSFINAQNFVQMLEDTLSSSKTEYFMYGDLNNDDKEDMQDAAIGLDLIKNYTSSDFDHTDTKYYSLDTNGDNDLNNEDVEQIRDRYLDGGDFTVWSRR